VVRDLEVLPILPSSFSVALLVEEAAILRVEEGVSRWAVEEQMMLEVAEEPKNLEGAVGVMVIFRSSRREVVVVMWSRRCSNHL
jgi:hypothetical protein